MSVELQVTVKPMPRLQVGFGEAIVPAWCGSLISCEAPHFAAGYYYLLILADEMMSQGWGMAIFC